MTARACDGGGLAILLIIAVYLVGTLWLAFKVNGWMRKALQGYAAAHRIPVH